MSQRDSKYGASPLHFAVWRGDALRARAILDGGASPNVLDADGQTPWAWAWAEAKGDRSMMKIVNEYRGGPSAVWSLFFSAHKPLDYD